ncbi:hypothetical protein [Streptomyces sp. URMC 129]|uniref:hypothetical protein n=1 Tax=Streptomyces sp. URMC 129 TaxID=3423407 RepID=UPI003F1B2B4D
MPKPPTPEPAPAAAPDTEVHEARVAAEACFALAIVLAEQVAPAVAALNRSLVELAEQVGRSAETGAEGAPRPEPAPVCAACGCTITGRTIGPCPPPDDTPDAPPGWYHADRPGCRAYAPAYQLRKD